MAIKTHILTKQEIGDAIANYIGVFKEGMTFFPFHIDSTDQELHIPETVMFHMKYIPMGSDIKKHNI
jgi:hypothetical protein